MKAQRTKKAERDDEPGDRRLKPTHLCRDPGPPVAEADFRASAFNPEEILTTAFVKMGRDYGGPLPADFGLHAVLTPPAAHSSIEATAEAE